MVPDVPSTASATTSPGSTSASAPLTAASAAAHQTPGARMSRPCADIGDLFSARTAPAASTITARAPDVPMSRPR